VSSRNSKKTLEGLNVSHKEFLKAKPMRNPDLKWEEDEKGVHIKPPQRGSLVSRLLPFRRRRGVVLDQQGTFIWKLCDGEHQIKEIGNELEEKYKMRASSALAALELYLVQLSKNGLIGFIFPESVRKRYHKAHMRPTEKSAKRNRE